MSLGLTVNHANQLKGSTSAIEGDSTTLQLDNERDFRLVKLVSQKDMNAFETLYQLHYKRTFFLSLRLLSHIHDAEDITQEVWLNVYRKAKTFRGKSAFTTWLYRLTINRVLMHFRKNYVRNERACGSLDKDWSHNKYPKNFIVKPNQLAVDDRLRLEEAIKGLPNSCKNVFELYYIDGYKHNEVARILGFSEGASKSQAHTAKMKIQHFLTEQVNRILIPKPRLLK
ncbi:MAG TPA: RNA polymerase sigma factor [Candidatus Doudnabacteria bacterium]|nr:RNA polymerase sigma factor [Candidatus Doudnabacteria bacterium]